MRGIGGKFQAETYRVKYLMEREFGIDGQRVLAAVHKSWITWLAVTSVNTGEIIGDRRAFRCTL